MRLRHAGLLAQRREGRQRAIMSMCSQSAPFCSTESHSCARQAKSEARMEGLIIVAGRSRPGPPTAGSSRRGAMSAPVSASTQFYVGFESAQVCARSTSSEGNPAVC